MSIRELGKTHTKKDFAKLHCDHYMVGNTTIGKVFDLDMDYDTAMNKRHSHVLILFKTGRILTFKLSRFAFVRLRHCPRKRHWFYKGECIGVTLPFYHSTCWVFNIRALDGVPCCMSNLKNVYVTCLCH